MTIPTIQLYGQFNGHWSNAGVSRGIAAGLLASGLRPRLYDETGIYEDLWTTSETSVYGGLWNKTAIAGLYPMGYSDADVGIFVGYAPHGIAPLSRHRVKVGFFIAESSILPSLWGAAAQQCDLVFCPSEWTRRAYIIAGADPSKTFLIPHGIHPVYRNVEPTPVHWSGGLNFLHVAGARDFIERKGTPQLIRAFIDLFNPTTGIFRCWTAHLTIRTPAAPQIFDLIQRSGCPELFNIVDSETALPPQRMRDFLLQGWTAIIQPSRTEAFGIIPVEARACGVPVILTGCSGHAQHLEPPDTVILAGPDTPLKVNGIPGGAAPSVNSGSILVAISQFLQNVPSKLDAVRGLARSGYYEKYNWATLLGSVADKIKALLR